MRHFTPARSRLTRLSRRHRVIYTVFLVFSIGALVSAVLLYADGPGWSLESVRRYYRGSGWTFTEGPGRRYEDTGAMSPAPRSPLADGLGRGAEPVVDLPDFDPSNQRREPVDVQIDYPRSYRQILENAHQHLFMMPVMFLVLAHLFAMTGVRRRWVNGFIALSAVGVAGHLAGPWLVRFVGGGWAWVMPATLGAMLLGFGMMIGGALVVMWWPGAPRAPEARSRAEEPQPGR